MVRRIITGIGIAVIVLSALRVEGFGRRLGDEELVNESDLILIGQVVHVAPGRWNDRQTMIYTDVTLTVSAVLKGSNPASTFTFSVPGGVVGEAFVVIVGEAFVVIEGVPAFDEEERYGLWPSVLMTTCSPQVA
jgi:hypothetical protein